METIITKLGQITYNFSTLELTVSSFVNKLISDDSNIGAIVTSEMSFQNLMKAFDSLMKYKFSDKMILSRWDSLKSRLNDCEKERNVFIHSSYFYKVDTTDVVRLKVTSKLNRGLKICSTRHKYR